MPNRALYLYEVVDVIGQGQYEYMEHLWQDPVLKMPEMFGLQGAFYVCAAGGGRWPQVINIWDVGSRGWTGWASNVDRMNLKRRKAFYGDWWEESSKWRSGGFDRLCAGVPGSPTGLSPDVARPRGRRARRLTALPQRSPREHWRHPRARPPGRSAALPRGRCSGHVRGSGRPWNHHRDRET